MAATNGGHAVPAAVEGVECQRARLSSASLRPSSDSKAPDSDHHSRDFPSDLTLPLFTSTESTVGSHAGEPSESVVHHPDRFRSDRQRHDIPHRPRASTEGLHSTCGPRSGIRIPQKQPSSVFSQLTPPSSYSPLRLDCQNSYSTSAHLYPRDSTTAIFPDSPDSSILPVLEIKKHPKSIHNPDPRSHSRGISRSLTYSFGKPTRQSSFVDASSYESVPDSPAKMWLQCFAQKTAPIPAPDDEGQEIGPYTIGRQIGVGGFSVVKEAFTFENGKQLQHAVKIVRKHATQDEAGNETLQSHFEHEINVWKCMSNDYILPLLSVIDTSYATWAFTLLFSGGTLFDVYRQGLPPGYALKYSFQLASALRYLHQDVRVVHRDVKLENCVLDRPVPEGGHLRLCDFGLADFLPGDDTPSPRQQFLTPHAIGEGANHIRPEDMIAGGSLPYAAPEQIKSIIPLLNTAIDMWSYGVVVHALLLGELPFSDPFPPKLQNLILEGTWNKDRFLNRVDPEICDVVLNCLQMNPEVRWSAADVLASQWISTYAEIEAEDR